VKKFLTDSYARSGIRHLGKAIKSRQQVLIRRRP
jgi:hypothetical protein